ncbi:MAG: InlB B-repeat-containing protein, partial [Firmicutes bacterium]|nr:InlB B-repeat-containing protein [Bacillota bacterium]
MEGKTFGGWYKNTDLGVKWDFAKDTVTKDITLFAKWSVEVPDGSVLVSFDLNGGTLDGKDTYEKTVLAGSLMTPPNDPVRDGWVFGAWLLDGEIYGFDKPVTQAMTLVADLQGFETGVLEDGTMEIKGIGTIERVTGGVLRIPQTIDGVSVTSIGEFAFCPKDDSGNVYEGGDWFVEAVLPEGLVNIGDNAFLNNRTYLTTINLPSTLKRIGASSLNGCRSLVFE